MSGGVSLIAQDKAQIDFSALRVATPHFANPEFIIGLNPGIRLNYRLNRRLLVSTSANYFYSNFRDAKRPFGFGPDGEANLSQFESSSGLIFDLGAASNDRQGFFAIAAETGFKRGWQLGVNEYSFRSFETVEYNVDYKFLFAQIRPSVNIRAYKQVYISLSLSYQYGFFLCEKRSKIFGESSSGFEGNLAPFRLSLFWSF